MVTLRRMYWVGYWVLPPAVRRSVRSRILVALRLREPLPWDRRDS
jgi:hypothetical protein